jgi:hypothetical protein
MHLLTVQIEDTAETSLRKSTLAAKIAASASLKRFLAHLITEKQRTHAGAELKIKLELQLEQTIQKRKAQKGKDAPFCD